MYSRSTFTHFSTAKLSLGYFPSWRLTLEGLQSTLVSLTLVPLNETGFLNLLLLDTFSIFMTTALPIASIYLSFLSQDLCYTNIARTLHIRLWQQLISKEGDIFVHRLFSFFHVLCSVFHILIFHCRSQSV